MLRDEKIPKKVEKDSNIKVNNYYIFGNKRIITLLKIKDTTNKFSVMKKNNEDVIKRYIKLKEKGNEDLFLLEPIVFYDMLVYLEELKGKITKKDLVELLYSVLNNENDKFSLYKERED